MKKILPMASLAMLVSPVSSVFAEPLILVDGEEPKYIYDDRQYEWVSIERAVLIIDGGKVSTPAIVEVQGDVNAPGVLQVIGGGELNAAVVYVTSSRGKGSAAILKVDGQGSGLTSVVGVNIGGDGGVGFFDLSNGARANTFTSPLGDYIGINGGTGIAFVSGDGTIWNSSRIVLGDVGEDSRSVLKVFDGALLKADYIEAKDNNSAWIIVGDFNSPTRPGEIDVEDIKLDSSNSYLILNHLDYNYSADWNVTGAGGLYSYSGTTELGGINDYSGPTVVAGSLLRAGAEGAFSQNSHFYLSQTGGLDLNGINQSIGELSSAGHIYLNQSGNSAGTTLTVNGDYHGGGGTLHFNTVLEGDDSRTDSLHITGNADGGTNVVVNNLGGQGAQTIEGIRLISVDGSIAPDTEFRQVGRIVAGAYDYRLVQGGNGGDSNSWYLTSGLEPVDPTDPIDPTDPELPAPPAPPTPPEVSTSRPEAGSYMSNLAAANEMFMHRLEDRTGERLYTDPVTGEQKLTTLWARVDGRHIRSRDQGDQLENSENRYVVQLGGEVAQGSFDGGKDGWHLGVMAGYGNSSSDSSSKLTDFNAKGSVDGYSVGLYGTWFQEEHSRKGAYVDTWVQHAWFKNSVEGEGLAEEKYDSKGLQASVESGYTFELGKEESSGVFIQPQAQVIWSGIKADKHREDNGTEVSPVGEDNIHTRLGVKVFKEMATDDTGSRWAPYVAANWHHNTKVYGVKMDDVTQSMAGIRNTGEVKLGVDGALSKNLSVWGSVGGQFGEDSYSNAGASLGINYKF
ncbi:autotransporter outer membrane beta-barrel domain-containing protein [Pseudomonas sp. QL9]|uniref:autotransporter outer membrane beta-barrel domain-containing protein n=1 Tax=Pseudomonas sp. QL9 TaxID=3242725 RepID=UPI00352BB587